MKKRQQSQKYDNSHLSMFIEGTVKNYYWRWVIWGGGVDLTKTQRGIYFWPKFSLKKVLKNFT